MGVPRHLTAAYFNERPVAIPLHMNIESFFSLHMTTILGLQSLSVSWHQPRVRVFIIMKVIESIVSGMCVSTFE